MVKVWGKRNHRKYVQNTEILRYQVEIWQSRGNERFFRNRRKWSERTKIEGEIWNLWSMTKKKFWRSQRNFSEIGGKSETKREMHYCLRGVYFMWILFKYIYSCSYLHCENLYSATLKGATQRRSHTDNCIGLFVTVRGGTGYREMKMTKV